MRKQIRGILVMTIFIIEGCILAALAIALFMGLVAFIRTVI